MWSWPSSMLVGLPVPGIVNGNVDPFAAVLVLLQAALLVGIAVRAEALHAGRLLRAAEVAHSRAAAKRTQRAGERAQLICVRALLGHWKGRTMSRQLSVRPLPTLGALTTVQELRRLSASLWKIRRRAPAVARANTMLWEVVNTVGTGVGCWAGGMRSHRRAAPRCVSARELQTPRQSCRHNP